MADTKKEEKPGKLTYISICSVENGYKIDCQYESEPTLSQKAGWINGPGYCSSKCYVEKTKDAVIERLKKVL